jgi:hypothetical protein
MREVRWDVLALIAAACAVATSSPADTISGGEKLPPRFKALCGLIDSGKEEDANSANYFVYQTIILEGAGVTPSDDKVAIARKVGKLFIDHVSRIRCSNVEYAGGSLLRFAAYKGLDAFIEDIAGPWHVPAVVLNQVDRYDGATLLDYIGDEIAISGPARAKQLQGYIKLLTEAGARNRVDIDGLECRREGGFTPDARCRER